MGFLGSRFIGESTVISSNQLEALELIQWYVILLHG